MSSVTESLNESLATIDRLEAVIARISGDLSGSGSCDGDEKLPMRTVSSVVGMAHDVRSRLQAMEVSLQAIHDDLAGNTSRPVKTIGDDEVCATKISKPVRRR